MLKQYLLLILFAPRFFAQSPSPICQYACTDLNQRNINLTMTGNRRGRCHHHLSLCVDTSTRQTAPHFSSALRLALPWWTTPVQHICAHRLSKTCHCITASTDIYLVLIVRFLMDQNPNGTASKFSHPYIVVR